MDKNSEDQKKNCGAGKCDCADGPPVEITSVQNEKCTCPTTTCPRHGNCQECVSFHRDVKGNLPVCLRPLAVNNK
jgi:hypothetical protein